MKKSYFLYICLLFLTACSAHSVAELYKKQNKIESLLPKEFTVQKFQTSFFTLYGLLRPAKEENKTLHVYIEGDGLAWVTRTQPSVNPTPTDNVTPMLARNDKSNAAVLYLARPCQYLEINDKKQCQQKYWTSHRLASEVTSSLDEAITEAKKRVNAQEIVIVGYSGGGGVAALIASKRDDVKFLGSVAGLLDHRAWTKGHKVSPLKGSLNPADIAHKVKDIKQLHLTSTSDDIIKPFMQENYCQKLADTNACRQVKGIEHNGAWYRVWNYNY